MARFDGIEEFVAIYEEGGFTAAAKRLGASVSYVSRQLGGLEEALGVRLFNRSTRRVTATPAGQNYYRACAGLLTGLDEANKRIAREQIEPSGHIRIAAGGKLFDDRIMPIIADFMARHPRVSVEINLAARNVDLIEERFDFAIRYGRLADSSLIARKLTDRTVGLAAAPAYLEARGHPRKPSDLAGHDCIVGNTDHWRLRFADGYRSIRIAGRLQIDSSGEGQIVGALKGAGIVHLPLTYLDPYLATGELLPVLKQHWPDDIATWVVYPHRDYVPERVRLLRDAILAEFAMQA